MLDRDEQLKVSSTGLKLFERQEAKVSICSTMTVLEPCSLPQDPRINSAEHLHSASVSLHK